MKSTKQKQTSTRKPEHSANSMGSRIVEAMASADMLEAAKLETAEMLVRKKKMVAEGAALIRRDHPDLVHLLTE